MAFTSTVLQRAIAPFGITGRIVQAYDDPVVRAYCAVRFSILRRRFLYEIGQYIPATGSVLDVGCGFGLFALYFASQRPSIRIHGLDLSSRRIDMARRAAARLGLTNVTFEVADAASFRLDRPVTAAYMMDLVHHIPPDAVSGLVSGLARNLQTGGCVLIKDIEPSPAYKLAFTWLLDKVMDPRAPVRYWAPDEIHSLMESLGFTVRRHSMIDYLPYPHVLYVNSKGAES